ncbi:hypothetical protein WP2S18C03_00280 [Aeromonas veronii]|nr:hypothetical protein WP2S18C03_00280 [Aeromonas veronii]
MHNRISIFSRYPALMAAMVLGGCTLKPPSTDEMLSTIAVAHPQSESAPSLLLTNNGFCVGIARQQAVTQVCTDKDAQPLEWDLGELKLQQTCLQARWLITSCRSANNIMPITFFLPAFIASSFYSA